MRQHSNNTARSGGWISSTFLLVASLSVLAILFAGSDMRPSLLTWALIITTIVNVPFAYAVAREWGRSVRADVQPLPPEPELPSPPRSHFAASNPATQASRGEIRERSGGDFPIRSSHDDIKQQQLRETARLLRWGQQSPTVHPGVAGLLGSAAEQVERAVADHRALQPEPGSGAEASDPEASDPEASNTEASNTVLRDALRETDVAERAESAEVDMRMAAAAIAYAVVLEGATNAIMHAHARQIHVRFTAGVQIEVCVHDDGIGGAEVRSGGGGLRALKDGVEALGGTLDLSSTPGLGSVLLVQLPWDRHAQARHRIRVAA